MSGSVGDLAMRSAGIRILFVLLVSQPVQQLHGARLKRTEESITTSDACTDSVSLTCDEVTYKAKRDRFFDQNAHRFDAAKRVGFYEKWGAECHRAAVRSLSAAKPYTNRGQGLVAGKYYCQAKNLLMRQIENWLCANKQRKNAINPQRISGAIKIAEDMTNRYGVTNTACQQGTVDVLAKQAQSQKADPPKECDNFPLVTDFSSFPSMQTDVQGNANVVIAFQKVISALYYARKRMPNLGTILYGPPGTGKTFLTKAFAHDVQAAMSQKGKEITFIPVKPAQVRGELVGQSEKAIKALFDCARAVAPTVLFFDEGDAIFGKATSGSDSNVRSQLLQELEGFSSNKSSIVIPILATNFLEKVDDAARSRLPRQIYVPVPSRFDIVKLLVYNIGKQKVSVPGRDDQHMQLPWRAECQGDSECSHGGPDSKCIPGGVCTASKPYGHPKGNMWLESPKVSDRPHCLVVLADKLAGYAGRDVERLVEQARLQLEGKVMESMGIHFGDHFLQNLTRPTKVATSDSVVPPADREIWDAAIAGTQASTSGEQLEEYEQQVFDHNKDTWRMLEKVKTEERKKKNAWVGGRANPRADQLQARADQLWLAC